MRHRSAKSGDAQAEEGQEDFEDARHGVGPIIREEIISKDADCTSVTTHFCQFASRIRGSVRASGASDLEGTSFFGNGFDSICIGVHNMDRTWTVLFHEAFDEEFGSFRESLQDELLAHAKLLQSFGPNLGRPTVDTLKGSRYPNMKELRFSCAGEVWRVAFAFDPRRQAILLVGGDKSSVDQRLFYRRLIKLADTRYAGHIPFEVVSRSGSDETASGCSKRSFQRQNEIIERVIK